MTAPKKAPGKLKVAVDETVQKLNQEVASRGVRATNALRNAELEVLRGQRSGRVYRKPHSKARYTASAPGEPPARRTGMLRMNWNGTVESASSGSGEVFRVSRKWHPPHGRPPVPTGNRGQGCP